ncbi:MAG: tRNA pseudouridine(55) synthase TruB [Firmicutes bacterium]|nr:tRNA pseudouridine(55) synthase TruB [Bacillota bacterium]
MVREGILNINKPAGMTSHDCIYAVRRLTGIKRIGHTGTLDPNATGVLPVCIGTCARVAEYTELDYKSYDCTMQLGLVTDTQDIWGEVLCDKRVELLSGKISVTEDDIRKAFAPVSGLIDQYPPKYSAVRYGGKRLYEYARDGQEIEIKPRRVYIESIEIKDIDLEKFTVRFDVTCGKGTYIRAICNDVGEALGCGAAMSALVRTGSGEFKIEDAVPLEYLKELTARGDQEEIARELERLTISPDFPLTSFGRAVIKTSERTRWFINGGHIRMSEVRVEREPKYKNEDAPFEIREEYRHAYAVYGFFDENVAETYAKKNTDGSNNEAEAEFLGVAFYNFDFKKLVADKIFRRQD